MVCERSWSERSFGLRVLSRYLVALVKLLECLALQLMVSTQLHVSRGVSQPFSEMVGSPHD